MKIWDVLLEAVLDTASITPVLLLVYLLVEFFAHSETIKSKIFFKKAKWAGPAVGSFLGAIPQCGFSSVMADLFNKKTITLGALIAVFVSTSDEAIPIFLGYPEKVGTMFLLIGIKIVAALFFGYLIDFIIHLYEKKRVNKKQTQIVYKDLEELEHVCGPACEKLHESHEHEHCHECNCCGTNIFVSAIKHTATILLYILIANILIGLIVESVGIENLSRFFGENSILSILLAPLVGMIPNCAASVFLVDFYLAGGLSFSALVAGLCAGSGVGLLVLAKNKNWKQTLAIIGLLYLIGVTVGIVVSLF
ncbi:MAG: putative manganese transporter [Clostridia bacterium]